MSMSEAFPGENTGKRTQTGATESRAGQKVSGDDENMDTQEKFRQKTGEVIDEVQDKAKDVFGNVQEQVTEQISAQKARVAEGLGSVANMVRMGSEQLRQNNQGGIAHYTDDLAHNLEDFSGYLRNHDLGEVVGEVENVARRSPALFLGGAFALGLLAGRFLKSSGNQAQTQNTAYGQSSSYNTAGSGQRTGYNNYAGDSNYGGQGRQGTSRYSSQTTGLTGTSADVDEAMTSRRREVNITDESPNTFDRPGKTR